MRCWQFGLFLLFSLVSLDVWAQDLPDIERLLEGNDILNTEDGYEEMVDILSNLLMTPVNVNTAGFDSLKMLFLLSDSQIDQLLEFRKKYGNSYQRVIVGAGNWEERSGEYPVFHYFRASGSAGPGESDKVT